MTSTTTAPLTNAEISHLETLLASPTFKKQAMGLDEIQGFLCAVLSGPERATPEQWLPAVLGNPEYESADQADALKALLLRFHSEIVADLAAGESLGLVLNLADPSNAAVEGEYDYGAWCQAYLDGVESSVVPWTQAGDENEINELLFHVVFAFLQIANGLLNIGFTCLNNLTLQSFDVYFLSFGNNDFTGFAKSVS